MGLGSESATRQSMAPDAVMGHHILGAVRASGSSVLTELLVSWRTEGPSEPGLTRYQFAEGKTQGQIFSGGRANQEGPDG